PLAISTGAGSASRHSIGTGVVGGMIAATALAIFFVPLFFLLLTRDHRRAADLPGVPSRPDPGESPGVKP
ncbi:MAG: efflux RND transporter permease subunit, partial [Bradyrhizobium sp.]